jgi:hypothetical protein
MQQSTDIIAVQGNVVTTLFQLPLPLSTFTSLANNHSLDTIFHWNRRITVLSVNPQQQNV